MTVKPFAEAGTNYLEVINELTISACGCHMILFTEYLADPYTQYQAGWSLLLITLVIALINLAFIAVLTLKSLHKTGKYQHQKAKARRAVEITKK